jgi:hypothetical protein
MRSVVMNVNDMYVEQVHIRGYGNNTDCVGFCTSVLSLLFYMIVATKSISSSVTRS